MTEGLKMSFFTLNDIKLFNKLWFFSNVSYDELFK